MSYADVVSQMQAIEARFAQLGLAQSSSTTVNANSAATFASALDSASSTSATTATASTDGVVSPNGATGDDVVQAALDYKGVPYVLGGESKSGIDCSGLVQAALAKVGVDVPRTVTGQKTVGQEVGSLKDAKPGDLIVLNGGDHIAIYMGNDTVIHAPYAGRTVSVQKAWFDDEDIVTIRRVVPATDDAGTTSSMPTLGATATAATTDTSASTSSGLSSATVAKATSMLSTYGADVGLYDSTGSSGGTSLSSLLSSFGLSGSTTSSTSPATSSAAQQILAARTALLGGTS